MNNFHYRLKELRRESNKSLKQLSEETGISFRTIQSYELQDRTPAVIDILIALADYFDVTLDYLVGRSDDK